MTIIYGEERRAELVWDNHGCMPLRMDAEHLPQLSRYRNAGVTVVSINIGFGNMTAAEHLKVLSFMRRWLEERPAGYRLVHSTGDVDLCRQDGKLGVTFDIEGMVPVVNDHSLIKKFYDLGVRWMLVAYNRNNPAGGGCLDPDGGLTDVGRAIIDEMEQVGMVLCLSHTGEKTAVEAIEYCRNPPIFSHSNPYGDTPHARNVGDDLMRACARKGGVIGLSGFGVYLGANTHLVPRLLEQIRYVTDLVGPEHVGLGLDYVFDTQELLDFARANPSIFPADMVSSGAVPMVSPEALSEIANGLARDHLTDSQIKGILGENWLRIAGQVWR